MLFDECITLVFIFIISKTLSLVANNRFFYKGDDDDVPIENMDFSSYVPSDSLMGDKQELTNQLIQESSQPDEANKKKFKEDTIKKADILSRKVSRFFSIGLVHLNTKKNKSSQIKGTSGLI